MVKCDSGIFQDEVRLGRVHILASIPNEHGNRMHWFRIVQRCNIYFILFQSVTYQDKFIWERSDAQAPIFSTSDRTVDVANKSYFDAYLFINIIYLCAKKTGIMDISIIVPLLNEEESLPELEAWIRRVMEQNSFSYEIVFVDDGSTDGSWSCIQKLKKNSKHLAKS